MDTCILFTTVVLSSIFSCEAFYQPKHFHSLPTIVPKSNEELKKALAGDTPTRVVLDHLFDFTGSEGSVTEQGCYYKDRPKECLTKGQKMLKVNSHCDAHKVTQVTYSKAGRHGLEVGSNKIIVGEKNGGLKGKGLRLIKSQNVEIRNLRITDINAEVVWGGDAIDLTNVHNVLIDNCYFKNIGRQMIVSHWNGASTGVTVSNSVFDGYSQYSADCRGHHYWLWLFLGPGDQITLQNNVITGTCGRGPKLSANWDKKSLLHMIQNIFYDVPGGLLDLGDRHSSVLMEGNIFLKVRAIVTENKGNIFMTRNSNEAKFCESYLGRQCLQNIVVNSRLYKGSNSNTALNDFKGVQRSLTKPIDMKKSLTKWITVPNHVTKYIP